MSKTLYILVTIHLLLFTFLLVYFPENYNNLLVEDGLIENLTSVFLFLSGLTIILTGLSIRKKFNSEKRVFWEKIIFLIIGCIFILGAGEEISWGQRIFDIETPEKLKEINDQDELNIHNINKKLFDRLLDRFTILFTIISSILLILKRKSFFQIPLPDIFIILSFAITPFYIQYTQFNWDFFHLQYIIFIILLFWGLKTKDFNLIGGVIFTIVLSLLIPFFHHKYAHHFAVNNNSANELREYLFSLCCMFYAYYIYRNIRSENAIN